MYSKEELSAKDMAELQDIAHEMGIEPPAEGNPEELVYAILDRQAEIEGNKNPLGTKRRRTRITKKTLTLRKTRPTMLSLKHRQRLMPMLQR